MNLLERHWLVPIVSKSIGWINGNLQNFLDVTQHIASVVFVCDDRKLNILSQALMNVRTTEEQDWELLKEIRLAALLDAPMAFGVSYQTASNYTDDQWKQRSSSETQPKFWLAFKDDKAIGMIGAGVDQTERYNLIAMWVGSGARGLGFADHLVNAVKSDSIKRGFKQVFLDVSPDNSRASRFYMKHGFVFIGEEKSLASHLQIKIQTMKWQLY